MSKDMPKENPKMIEVRKVVTDRESGCNTGSELYIQDVGEITAVRPWHKNPHKDAQIKGEMTILILKKQVTYLNHDEKFKPKTMLIEESYESFKDRLQQKVPFARLE